MAATLGFQNAQREYTEPVRCLINNEQAWPRWLQGTLYRAGPGIFDVGLANGGLFSFQHWFDGLTLLHRFEITEGGQVMYQSRFTAKSLEKRIHDQNGARNLFTFGQDLCQSTFWKFLGMFNPSVAGFGDGTSDSANIGEKRLMIKTDASLLQQVDEKTLEPKHLFTYADTNPSLTGIGAAAHEEFDPVTGDYFNFTMDFGSQATYHLFKIDGQTGACTQLCKLHAEAAYVHSFASTQHYLVLILWPYFFSAYGLSVLYNKNYTDSLRFDEKKPVRFFVIDRETGEVKATYEHDAFYVFHTVNAFEDAAGDILIDACAYPNANIVRELRLENLRSDDIPLTPSSYRRWRLPAPIQHGKAKQVMNIKVNIELPRINDAFRQRQHRYAYGVSRSEDERRLPFDSIVKVDSQTQNVKRFHGHGRVPGEAIFIARPGAREEDDGVLLTVLLDPVKKVSVLAVLDAKTMELVVEAQAPDVIPFGFHGAFTPQAQ